MNSSEKTPGKNIKIARIKLTNGWRARVMLSGVCGKNFSKTDWIHCLSQPHLLFKDVEKILKTEDLNCVAVKNLIIGNSRLKVVIKRHCPATGLRQFFRSFRPGKSLRNFKTALKLLSCGIEVAAPFAALHQRPNLLTKQSIYIAEYLENSFDLYTFCSEELPKIPFDKLALKKQLCHQLAVILASLYHNTLWHRDSKATNFIVCRETAGKYKISLVDMDGIKPCLLQRKSRRFRSLWQLAASLMPVSTVNRTDHLRVFTAYCNLTGLETSQRRRVFRELISLAKAKRLRSTLKYARDLDKIKDNLSS